MEIKARMVTDEDEIVGDVSFLQDTQGKSFLVSVSHAEDNPSIVKRFTNFEAAIACVKRERPELKIEPVDPSECWPPAGPVLDADRTA